MSAINTNIALHAIWAKKHCDTNTIEPQFMNQVLFCPSRVRVGLGDGGGSQAFLRCPAFSPLFSWHRFLAVIQSLTHRKSTWPTKQGILKLHQNVGNTDLWIGCLWKHCSAKSFLWLSLTTVCWALLASRLKWGYYFMMRSHCKVCLRQATQLTHVVWHIR